jgi:hypothetical protein
LPNKVFASCQAIREASLTVSRPTVHGSETSRTQKRSLCGFAASSGVLNPQGNKKHIHVCFLLEKYGINKYSIKRKADQLLFYPQAG